MLPVPTVAAGPVDGVVVLPAVALAVLVGAVLVGAGLRVVLGRLPRGTGVRPGPCEAGLVAAWLPAGVATAAGAAPPAWAPLWLGVGVLAAAGSVTDLTDHRLPDALTLPALPAVLVLTAPLGPGAVARAGGGALVLAAVFGATFLAAPGALGGGDVKLAPALGGALAAGSWWALLLGPALAALGVLVVAAVRHRRAVPFGPPALVATWALVGAAAITLGRPG